ncbi:hypothetical protein ACFLU4_05035 [Chloroflexota bacterium]
MGLAKAIKRYKKKLEKRFSKQVARVQCNFVCDSRIAQRLRGLARRLEVPIYVLAEHILQLGLQEVLAIMDDEALHERLCRHLVQDHLLCPATKPETEPVSRRAQRIGSTLMLLKLLEVRTSPEEQQQIIQGLIGEDKIITRKPA